MSAVGRMEAGAIFRTGVGDPGYIRRPFFLRKAVISRARGMAGAVPKRAAARWSALNFFQACGEAADGLVGAFAAGAGGEGAMTVSPVWGKVLDETADNDDVGFQGRI